LFVSATEIRVLKLAFDLAPIVDLLAYIVDLLAYTEAR